ENVNKGLNSLANSPGLTTFTDNVVSGIENLTPTIVNMVSRFVDFANNPDVQNLFSGVIQGASQLIGFVIDATVNVSSFIGSFAGIDGIATSVGVLAGGFVAVKAAMVGMGAVNGIMGLIETLGAGAAGATGVSGIGAAFTALTGPVGIAIAAVTAISAVLVGAYNSSEIFRNSIGTAFESIGQTAQAAFNKVAVAFAPVLPVFEHFGTAINPILKQIGDVMGNYVVPAITFMVNTFITGFANLVTLFAPFLSALGNVFSFIGNGVGAVCALLNGDWTGAWLFAQQMCQNACDFVTNILSGFWGMLTTIIGGIATTVYD
ncbi:MAG: hypothetical protein L6276_12395, partial [Acetobacterium sp.]|nr:hypothetical protein [Acetobacterium sp.]